MAAFAQYEREQISIRTKEALAAAKRRGIKLGEHGKKLASRNGYKATCFAKQMKPIIDMIMTDGATSTRKIALELNKRKIPTYRPGNQWHKSSVHNLLRRIKQIGEKKVMLLEEDSKIVNT